MLPPTVIALVVCIALTTMRALMIKKVRTVHKFGGKNPNEWLGPWVTDSIWGLLAPGMAVLAAMAKGNVLWGVLILYNSVGAFDYGNGLLTQYLSPQRDGEFTPAQIYGAIGFGLLCNAAALVLLFTDQASSHFMPGVSGTMSSVPPQGTQNATAAAAYTMLRGILVR